MDKKTPQPPAKDAPKAPFVLPTAPRSTCLPARYPTRLPVFSNDMAETFDPMDRKTSQTDLRT